MLRICAGQFKGKQLKLPPQSIARPSSNKLRQAVFNILENLISFQNLRVLDAFAGSGALGLEALSRGAGQVVFCENNSLVQKVLKDNISSITNNQVTVASNIFKLMPAHPFDLVFLDPPYDQNLEQKTLQYLIEKKLIAPKSIVVVEQRKGAAKVEHKSFTTQPPRVYGQCQVTFLWATQS